MQMGCCIYLMLMLAHDDCHPLCIITAQPRNYYPLSTIAQLGPDDQAASSAKCAMVARPKAVPLSVSANAFSLMSPPAPPARNGLLFIRQHVCRFNNNFCLYLNSLSKWYTIQRIDNVS